MTARLSRSPRFASTLDRRTFLAALGAVGLSACAGSGRPSSFDLGGGSNVRILNWSDYIDADDSGDLFYDGGTLNLLRQAGLSVSYSPEYTDNISGFERVLREAVEPDSPAFDIVVPTNWRAAQMIANGWAEPLPIEVIPNHANINPAFLTNAWDRGCRFQMPWQAGVTGIAYDPALTGRPLTSIEDLFDPAFAGRVGFIGEMREAVGLAMLADGADPSRPTAAAAEAGLARIQDAVDRGQVGAFTFGDFADRLASGELAAAMAWSGDTALLRRNRPDIEFLVPDEGAIQWFDTMVIPARAPNIAGAGEFMNFVYDPENAARITEWVQFISPVIGVQEVLAAAGGEAATLAADPVLFPDATTRARLFTWGGLDVEIEDSLDERFGQFLP